MLVNDFFTSSTPLIIIALSESRDEMRQRYIMTIYESNDLKNLKNKRYKN
jgi:hypothetical protein